MGGAVNRKAHDQRHKRPCLVDAFGPAQGERGIKKPPSWIRKGDSGKRIGGDLLSHQVSLAVPSAREGLTSVCGMGTGVTPLLWPPKSVNYSFSGVELESSRAIKAVVVDSG